MNVLIKLVTVLFFAIIAVSARASPILYVSDNLGVLGTVDVTTKAVTVIGNTHQDLTDIAFDASGNLYGISFTSLYSINKATAATTLIGNFGVAAGALNSLAFGSDGTLYAANTALYSINKATGAASEILSGNNPKPFNSSGDLAFLGGGLFLTSVHAGSDELFTINTNNGHGSDVGAIGFSNVFGLASTDATHLYGISGTELLSINSATGAGTDLGSYGGHGLGAANGAAFFAVSVPASVPEPATLALLGLGLLGFRASRRKSAK